jgi:Domain of unknown function (DUF5615)
VKLCLDEHYSPKIAEDLRLRGHDVYAVSERLELRMLSDGELWSHVQSERRALLTENVADFSPFIQEAAAAGDDHWGIIFSSPRAMPRGSQTIGLFVERLHELLTNHPKEKDFSNGVHWLHP